MVRYISFILLLSGLYRPELFCQKSADNFREHTVLETTNAFTGQWSCVNNGYIYGTGINNDKIVLRRTETSLTYETRGNVTMLNPNYRIQNRLYTTSTPNVIFVLVSDSIDCSYLLRSTDGGSTFKNVFAFGEGNGALGANAPSVRLLRGLLELTRSIPSGKGKGDLFIAEYNINQKRVKGSVNDRVRIMKSDDEGDTWTKVVEWNTNGSNQIGHIHAMKQDPYTGEIYICTGDDNSKASIIKWDGSSPWKDNLTMAQIGSLTGFKVFSGAQRYRVCDVLFDQNYFYTFSDTQTPNNPTGSESGIWRGKKDFSSYNRMDNKIFSYDPMHIGWFGEKIGDTFIFTTAREYVNPLNAWKEISTQVYMSNDGINWYNAGVINWRDVADPTQSRYIANLFTYNDKLYIDCMGGAGHFSTIVCDLSRKWRTYEDPVILHPVYFVGKWNTEGNDANKGISPDAPKKTLKGAMTSNNISAGARVRVAEGEYIEPGIYAEWSGAYFQGRGNVIIEGQGMNRTNIRISSTQTGAYGIQLKAARTLTGLNAPLILKDLHISIAPSNNGSAHSNYVLYNIDSYIKTIGCKIGNSDNDDSPLVRLDKESSRYDSENSIHIASSDKGAYKEIVQPGEGNTTFNLNNCIIVNAFNAFHISYPDTKFSLNSCTLYGIENSGVILDPLSNTQPFIKNSIFICGSSPLIDLSGTKETDIDYNLYNRENTNISDGGNSLDTGTDPMFVDPQNQNFNLKINSACGMKGSYIANKMLYDFSFRERKNPPSIGAFENQALLVSPAEITIGSLSGSASNFNITSNTDWKISDYDHLVNLSALSGTGNSTISVITTSANNSQNPREIKISIYLPDSSIVSVVIIQTGQIITNETGIQKLTIKAYPNPVSGVLNIQTNDENVKSVSVFNSNGILLIKKEIVSEVQQIDFSGFEKGLYILEFEKDGEIKRTKIINQ